MVVKPSDLLGAGTDDPVAIHAAEVRLDTALRGHDFGGSRKFTYSESIFNGISRRGREELLEQYRRAGWTIAFVPDSRDGNYYEFRK